MKVCTGFLVDYRPVLDQVEVVTVTSEAADPAVFHDALASQFAKGGRVQVIDHCGDSWPFEAETVRAFWTVAVVCS